MDNHLMKKVLLLVLTFLILIPAQSIFASQSITSSSSVYKEIGPAENLGRPIAQLTVFDGAGGTYNGNDYLYLTSSGTPAVFNVYNVTTDTVEHSIEIPEGATVWALTVEPLTGHVYIATTSEKSLLRYIPGTSTLQTIAVGGNIKGQVWSLTTDDQGNIYGGQFSPGAIFQYNPTTNQVVDWGTIKQGHEYVRSIAYHDGFIYAGLGAVGGIVKIDKDNPSNRVDIPLKKLAGLGESENPPFVYSLDVRGNYLFAHLQGNNHASYIIYDLVEGEWLNLEATVAPGLTVSEIKDNKVYFNSNGEVVYFDMTTETITSTGIANPSSFRTAFWANAKGYTEEVLVNVAYNGSVVLFDMTNQTRHVMTPMFLGGGLDIHTLERGNDGKLYMTGYTGSVSKAYDPATQTWQQFTMGQSESIGVSGENIYFGEYPHAKIFRLNQNDVGSANPQLILEIGEEQDRPYVNTFGDGYAFFGHIPTYTKNGGALAIFEESDPQGTLRVFRNIVQDQSIVGLAYKDGIIYGSTSVHGGLDSATITDSAKMFTFDVATGQKLDEWELNIPNYSGYISFISGLTFDENGLLWVVANGHILAIDPATKEIVKHQAIYPEVSNYGKWRPVHVRFHDGLIYTDIYGKLVIVNPNTMEYNDLGISTVLFTLDTQGNLYYAQGATLYKRTVSEMLYIPAGEVEIKSPMRVNPNETFTVSIDAKQAQRLNSGDLRVSFNNDVVELLDIALGSALAANTYLNYNVQGNQVRILFSEIGNSSGVTGQGSLLTLSFKAKDSISSASFILESTSTIGAVHTIESGILYPIGDAQVVTMLIRNGFDVTGDGLITISDVIAISKRIGERNSNYDINLDGVIDEKDVRLVSTHLLAEPR